MGFKYVFSRYEYKYIIDTEQKRAMLSAMEPYMKPDEYGRSTIRNIYFDTPSYLLIRRSIEGPVYKEKLRVRSYKRTDEADTVFVELKKKFNKVVYKRRVAMPYGDATAWLCHRQRRCEETQMTREIDYFLDYYESLMPAVFLSYEREAFFGREDSGFRITFDENILARTEDISLASEVGGTPLLPRGMSLMEIKCFGGMPLWLTAVLSEQKINKASFSKYGNAYRQMIFPELNFKETVNGRT